MIIEEIKNIKSGRKDLRKFGITVGIVFGLIGGLFLWRGKDYYLYFFILSGLLILPGLVMPVLLKPVHKVWMGFAILIGLFMTGVILSILYYLVVTPIGLLGRLFSKDFFDTKFYKGAGTYWLPKRAVTFEKENYEKQF